MKDIEIQVTIGDKVESTFKMGEASGGGLPDYRRRMVQEYLNQLAQLLDRKAI